MAASRLVRTRIEGAVTARAAAVLTTEAMQARKGGLPRFDSVQALKDDLHAED